MINTQEREVGFTIHPISKYLRNQVLFHASKLNMDYRYRSCMLVENSPLFLAHSLCHTHTLLHIYIYIYIYSCLDVWVVFVLAKVYCSI